MEWSPQFAYAVGLVATDGSLSRDGRHIELTSADKEQIINFLYCLQRDNKIGMKRSGSGKLCFRTQVGDVVLYRFLTNIGVIPNKSKVLGRVKVPRRYFFDFLRGHFDGDGTFYSYFDPRWKKSFMFYTAFCSASSYHILWLRKAISTLAGVHGHITKSKNNSVYQLKYAKQESLQLLPKMYYDGRVVCLRRKRLKIKRALRRIGEKI
ncbi:MAG: hypothetical protein AAB581_02180 [Patescibacteria group bacterium]